MQIADASGRVQNKDFWTKRGVVRLGFSMRSEKAKKFRDFAEDLVIDRIDQKQLSTLDILELTIKGMRENQQELQEVKKKVQEIEAKTKTRPDYFTVVGYGSLNGININLNLACRIGQKASRLCKDRGYETDNIPDPRFGQVKMYPKIILEEVFNKILIK